MKGFILLGLLFAAVAIAGCTNPDAPSSTQSESEASSPQNAGEPPASPPASPSAQAPVDVQPTPEKALAAFATLYVNWTYGTLSANQRQLAAISVGAARLSEEQAAAQSQADGAIARGHIFNRGQIVSIARDLEKPGEWVIVTSEQTGGDSEYAGLSAAYHVSLARLQSVRGAFAVATWSPQR